MKIRIISDDYCENPREWDNLGTMVCFHKRYQLGDPHLLSCEDFESFDQLEQDLIKNHNALVTLPLYLYDHSGIMISTTPFSCRWDSGQVGFIYADRDKVMEEYNTSKPDQDLIKLVTDILRHEVDQYNCMLRGEVYRFEIVDDNGEVLYTCSGYIGSIEDSGILTEAKLSAKHFQNLQIKRLKEQIKHRVPLDKRIVVETITIESEG